MSDQNGKPAPDPALLTPNDWRRLRVALKGKPPEQLLDTGQVEDMYQLLILAYRLREHPEFTWDEAGDVIPATVFDFTVAGQNPPAPPGSDAFREWKLEREERRADLEEEAGRLRTRAVLCQQYGLTPDEHDDLTFEMIDALIRVMNQDHGGGD